MSGYLIDAFGSTWLHRYLPRSECPNYFQGEPTDFMQRLGGHPVVSIDLRAKFAVWAFTLVPKARAEHDVESG